MITTALSNATNNLVSFGSASVPFSFNMLPDSYTISSRQSAFVESPAQRRARVVFIMNPAAPGGSDRVQSWVKSQSSYTNTSKMSSPPSPSASTGRSKGHRRNRHSISSSDDLKSHLYPSNDKKHQRSSSYSPRTSPTTLHYPAYHLTSIPEDEPYIFYSTPITVPLLQTHQKSSAIEGAAPSPSHSDRTKRHQRHLSDLMAIPEE
ncbi:hypothetical protein PM082_019476 [Marasmius tenuissimus]|nr:hypothetical protein PM082_019476 [Marasmius tenuissimus]